MYLKPHVRYKDGKRHIYFSLNESLRVSRKRVVQRTVLHLGELNTTQVERWQRTIETVQEDGRRQQMRLFTDREGQVPVDAQDVAEVILSSLVVRRPRRFGDCWMGCKLWEELGLRAFWEEVLGKERGQVSWAKVVELLAVNRLCAPRSELFIHEKWFGQTAMDLLLDCDAAVAEKDRLYRALDRMVEHKAGLEQHLTDKWRDLFGASFDVLLYDLTSTYFEGAAEEVDKAARGYSRDHRPDCPQLVIAVVVTPEGFPLTYEVFDGNRADVTTLEQMLDVVEGKHGRARRVWVFDRGMVSEANLEKLRQRGGQYVVGTPRHRLEAFEKQLLEGPWALINESVQVQLIPEGQETYVLARSVERAKKEEAMRWRQIRGLMRDLVRLRRSVRKGTLVDSDKVLMRLGRLSERWPRAWSYVEVTWQDSKLTWHWDRDALRLAQHRDGAYLLRTNLTEHTPEALWKMYVQLTEAEAVFRALKGDLAIRPLWHWTSQRVEAHVMVAFLGYCLWLCLKQKLKAAGPALTPWQLLDQFGRLIQVEVWFKLKAGGAICLPRITQPEPAQALLLHQLGWVLPEQPPPRIYTSQVADVWPT
jgi:transposase